jgi:hypothetical protein
LRLQRPQQVGAFLKLPPLALQAFDLRRQRTPVEVAEIVEQAELLQRAQPRLEFPALTFQIRDPVGDTVQALRDIARLLLQRGDLSSFDQPST